MKAIATFLLLVAPLASGAGFDVELTVNTALTYGGVSGAGPAYTWRIVEGSRVLGSGDWFKTKKGSDGFVTLESQLPFTVDVHSNAGFTDGYMLYRDMKRDFNQGADHCQQNTQENPFAFTKSTSCHFDHE